MMRLTPPTIPVFLVSVLVMALAIGDIYWHVPSVHGFIAAHRFGMVVVAYIVLAVGVVFKGL